MMRLVDYLQAALGPWCDQVSARAQAVAACPADQEALHALRVDTRRLRSVLSSLKGVWPAYCVRAIRGGLKQGLRGTGALRDAQVHCTLLAQARPCEDLIQEWQDWLAQREGLQARQQAGLAAGLAAGPMTQPLEWMRALLALPASSQGSVAAGPFARACLDASRKQVARLVRKAARPGYSPAQLHRLRLACKRLRYQLDFFRPLLPPKRLARELELLIKLQTCLGDLRDHQLLIGQLHSAPLSLALRRAMEKSLRRAIDRRTARLGKLLTRAQAVWR